MNNSRMYLIMALSAGILICTMISSVMAVSLNQKMDDINGNVQSISKQNIQITNQVSSLKNNTDKIIDFLNSQVPKIK